MEPRLQPEGAGGGEGGAIEQVEEEETALAPPQYMNSAALSEIAGELLITVRELREELLQVLQMKFLSWIIDEVQKFFYNDSL